MSTGRRLGARIRAARVRAGLTQEAVAKEAAVSRIYVAKLEAGERQSPSLPVLERVAKALRVTLVDLLK